MKNPKKFFKSANYSLVASLLTNPKVEMVDVEPNSTGGNQLLLTPYDLCTKLSNDYELNRLMVPARQIALNIQTIKEFTNDRGMGKGRNY